MYFLIFRSTQDEVVVVSKVSSHYKFKPGRITEKLKLRLMACESFRRARVKSKHVIEANDVIHGIN